jgi:hypothetical protein
MPLSVWARGDSSTAANASLNASNVKKQPATLLTFSADTNNDGIDDGDLKLNFTLDGSVDPNTVIYLDTNGDGTLDSGPVSFTMEFGGTLPFTNKLNGVGPNNTDLRGEEVVILTLDTGKRLFFLRSFLFDPDGPNAITDSQDTFDIMNDFPNGAHNLQDLFVCYVAGTRIKTPTGPVAIETLKAGDQIVAEGNVPVPVLFIGSQSFQAPSIRAFDKLRPIMIPESAIAPGEPSADLLVSPQHRILLRAPELQTLFGLDAAFVAARDTPFARPGPIEDTTYVHILCPTHSVIEANGCASESLYPGDTALASLSPEDAGDIRAILGLGISQKTAYPCLTSREAAVLREAIYSREKRSA